ncbi:hypothetical protein [Brasilonema bromeliae]|uniref:Uncharacterized protein n=1 Tax=Brasilonema bromeliae SPC951 TaxID=385972 RepID=A0ABX1P4E4_9CYAN|nr:hypothetical protein [Brasilonema bromeliae]NMG18601.1 hypothetical protein [Brasilonema bromeliae SPC951]
MATEAQESPRLKTPEILKKIEAESPQLSKKPLHTIGVTRSRRVKLLPLLRKNTAYAFLGSMCRFIYIFGCAFVLVSQARHIQAVCALHQAVA